MNAIAAKVSNAIVDAIEADRLVLPTMPEMALRVREVAEDDDASVQGLAKVIGSDAALTARIIKVANSAIYRGAQEIEDLNMALMRLGMATTCTLATGLAMEQMFQATSDMVDKRLRKTWAQSTEIAGMSTVLCKHYTKLRPEQATLAGLMHLIGVLPILSYAEQYSALLKDSITLESIIKAVHPKIGSKILDAWDFPQEIRNVPTAHLDFTRTATQPDYADIVTVALLQSRSAEYEFIDYTTVTAFDRLGLDPNIESTEAEDLSAEMAEAVNLLK